MEASRADFERAARSTNLLLLAHLLSPCEAEARLQKARRPRRTIQILVS